MLDRAIHSAGESMARAYQGVSVLFLLLGLFVLRESLQLRYFTRLGPGSGFFGVWLGGLMVALAVILFVQNTHPRWRREERLDFPPPRLAQFRIAVTIALLALTVVLLPALGFRLTVLGLALLLLIVVGRQRWFIAIVMSLAVSFGTFYVFDLLGIFLPTGPRGI